MTRDQEREEALRPARGLFWVFVLWVGGLGVWMVAYNWRRIGWIVLTTFLAVPDVVWVLGMVAMVVIILLPRCLDRGGE